MNVFFVFKMSRIYNHKLIFINSENILVYSVAVKIFNGYSYSFYNLYLLLHVLKLI